AAAILRIAAAPTKRWGTFHFTGGGETTWHGFAEAIVAGRVPVEPIATADYPTPARRPANSVLDCGKIAAAYGIVGRPWQVALGEVLGQI
ncbi:MAG TPA: sugar nucleotide-binding protein, partial [Stellaceae bacterium]|nr:sugar nucleotide-binding protein [Stellaceae bacterium]